MSSGAWSNGPDGRRPTSNAGASSSQDSEDFMNKLFTEAVGNNVDKYTYKPATSATSTKSTQGVSKITTMSNGKDFFAELKRQVQTLNDKEKAGG